MNLVEVMRKKANELILLLLRIICGIISYTKLTNYHDDGKSPSLYR